MGKSGDVKAGEAALAHCDAAAEHLRRAGFRLVHASMRSEACYYGLPGRDGLLRVAAHRFSGGERQRTADPVHACLTFQANGLPQSEEKLETMVALAVGRFVLRSKPRS